MNFGQKSFKIQNSYFAYLWTNGLQTSYSEMCMPIYLFHQNIKPCPLLLGQHPARLLFKPKYIFISVSILSNFYAALPRLLILFEKYTPARLLGRWEYARRFSRPPWSM